MKILYLAPFVPSTSGTGGRKVLFNHLSELVGSGHDVDLVVVDGNRCGEPCPDEFRDFSPALFPAADAGSSRPARALRIAANLLFDSRPWPIAAVRARAAVAYVRRLLADRRFDVIVADNLRAFGLIDAVVARVPVVYIASDVDSNLMRDELDRCRPHSLRRWLTWLTWRRVCRYEAMVLRRSTCVLAISQADALVFRDRPGGTGNVLAWPELPSARGRRWRHGATQRLLFVGSARHFPNLEAMNWLVSELMPRLAKLDPRIRLAIAGTTSAQAGVHPVTDNVDFLGYVSEEALERLHLESDLFVCPVVLGSGVKIKVLEAAAYGMPVLVTPQSMQGLEFLGGIAAVSERSVDTFAAAVQALLGDSAAMEAMSGAMPAALAAARQARPDFLSVLKASADSAAVPRTD